MLINLNETKFSDNFILHSYQYNYYANKGYKFTKEISDCGIFRVKTLFSDNKYYVFDIVRNMGKGNGFSLGVDENYYIARDYAAKLYFKYHKNYDYEGILDKISNCFFDNISIDNSIDILNKLYKDTLISYPRYSYSKGTDGKIYCELFVLSVNPNLSIKVGHKSKDMAKKLASLLYIDFYMLYTYKFEELSQNVDFNWIAKVENTIDEYDSYNGYFYLDYNDELNEYYLSNYDLSDTRKSLEELVEISGYNPDDLYYDFDETILNTDNGYIDFNIEGYLKVCHYYDYINGKIAREKRKLFYDKYNTRCEPIEEVIYYKTPILNIVDIIDSKKLDSACRYHHLTLDDLIDQFNMIQENIAKKASDKMSDDEIDKYIESLGKMEFTEQEVIDDMFAHEDIEDMFDEEDIEYECKEFNLTREQLQKYYDDLTDKNKKEYIKSHNIKNVK